MNCLKTVKPLASSVTVQTTDSKKTHRPSCNPIVMADTWPSLAHRSAVLIALSLTARRVPESSNPHQSRCPTTRTIPRTSHPQPVTSKDRHFLKCEMPTRFTTRYVTAGCRKPHKFTLWEAMRALRESRCSSTVSLTSALNGGVDVKRQAQAALSPRMTRYPL